MADWQQVFLEATLIALFMVAWIGIHITEFMWIMCLC